MRFRRGLMVQRLLSNTHRQAIGVSAKPVEAGGHFQTTAGWISDVMSMMIVFLCVGLQWVGRRRANICNSVLLSILPLGPCNLGDTFLKIPTSAVSCAVRWLCVTAITTSPSASSESMKPGSASPDVVDLEAPRRLSRPANITYPI